MINDLPLKPLYAHVRVRERERTRYVSKGEEIFVHVCDLVLAIIPNAAMQVLPMAIAYRG